MNKWITGLLLAAWPPAFFFGARTMSEKTEVFASDETPRNLSLVCTDGRLPNGMPCPTAKAANNRDARTISAFVDGSPLTIYADKDGKTPAMVIGTDGVVHFPFGANADTFSAGGSPVIDGGVWSGPKDNLKGDDAKPCTVTTTTTGARVDCGSGGAVELKNGDNGVSPGACTAVKTGTRTTITCPSGAPVDIIDGLNGTNCAGDSACLESVTTEVKNRARLTDIRRALNPIVAHIGFENAWEQSGCGGTDITEYLKKWYTIQGETISYFSKCWDCRTQSIVERTCRPVSPL